MAVIYVKKIERISNHHQYASFITLDLLELKNNHIIDNKNIHTSGAGSKGHDPISSVSSFDWLCTYVCICSRYKIIGLQYCSQIQRERRSS